MALDNARLYQNTQQRMDETRALYRAIQPLFNTVEDIKSLAEQITRAVTQEFSSAHCSILLVDESRTHLNLIAQAGSLKIFAPELPLEGSGLTVKAVLTGNSIYSPDVHLENDYISGADQSRSELVIPLQAGGQVIGVLNLESPDVDAFDERGQRLLMSFAEQAALGLENARLFETVQQNAHQMARLSNLAQSRAQEAENLRLATAAINSTLDLQKVLDSILNHIEQVLPHHSAAMFLVENEDQVRVWALKNIYGSEEGLYRLFPRDDTLFSEIEQARRAVILPNAMADTRFNDWAGTANVQGWMGIPLVAANEFVGILTLERHDATGFKPEEMDLAQAFANQAAIAVQNARLYEAAQQRARELEALHTATTSLVTTLDKQKLLERILEAAMSAIPSAQAAALHLMETDGQLTLQIQHGIDEGKGPEASPQWDHPHGPWYWALREHQPVLIGKKSPGQAECFLTPDSQKFPSYLIAPLIQEDQPLGVLTLLSSEPDGFTPPDLHLLISFASTATAAIHNARLHSAVQYLAVTDPLTGIYNRRGFFDLAQIQFQQARRYHKAVSAIMIDIDYFKQVNDRFGHDIGDVVLQKFAERCKKALRDTDMICRYGGEEFAILLPESDLTGAEIAAQRLFKNVTETPIETDSGPVLITISMGIAANTENCSTLHLLLKDADKALHHAKSQGRNQVQVWVE
jgi:diguanylate cyclase (GGDEF)-like protein